MADEKPQNTEGTPEEQNQGQGQFDDFASDSSEGSEGGGLGNLPPLSDFESSEGSGAGFDSNLPPLGSDDADEGGASVGGLPPISDIPVETPMPTGGNVKAPPPGFEETPTFDTPTSDSGLDTPSDSDSSSFQDLTADSDFTPETPEVGPPGPDSDMETPMFDSAFGGASSDVSGFGDTSAPTQAMETPMFGAEGPAPQEPDFGAGFDADAFGPSTGGEGTPMPDFSPDTGAQAGAEPAPAPIEEAIQGPPAAKAKKKGGGGVMGKLVAAVFVIIAFAVGSMMGPFVVDKTGLPAPMNPYTAQLTEKDTTISGLRGQVKKLSALQDRAEGGISPEEIDKLVAQKEDLLNTLEGLQTQVDSLASDAKDAQEDLDVVKADLAQTTEEYAQAEAAHEDLLNQTAIVEARQQGLTAEVGRLQGLVGGLTDANQRRVLTKDTLESHINELDILVREGNDFLPPKYAQQMRLAAVDNLRQEAANAKWVSPALLEKYTRLFLQELEIAASDEYFQADMLVTDRYGSQAMQKVECIMNGSQGTYWRTFDGKHVGKYQRISGTVPAQYKAIQFELGDEARAKISSEIVAKRPAGVNQEIEQQQAEQVLISKSKLQKLFDSL